MTERPEERWAQRARELLDQIPGYQGYRLKEQRRDADRRVRQAVADAYAGELHRVERIGRDLANARRLGDIGVVERANQAIRHFIDRVRTASPGYGGLFGDRDIDGVALDQLRLFDESLLLGVDELRAKVDALEEAATSGQPLDGPANDVEAVMERQILRLNTRNDVIETGLAAGEASVKAALQPISETAPVDAYTAQPGDAIAILGDNFLVDATIAVTGRPRSFRLLRLSREPEEWLLAPASPAEPILRLAKTEPPEIGMTIPGRAMRQVVAGTGDGQIATEADPGRLRAVRYALLEDAGDPEVFGLVLDWDGERQAFVGGQVEPLDIEVFRRSASAG